MRVTSYNSHILTTQEQKRCAYFRELCSLTFAFSQYALVLAPNSHQLFLDHNPIPLLSN